MSKEFMRLHDFLCDTINEYENEKSQNEINDIESIGSYFQIDENFEKPCVVFHIVFRKGESRNYFYIEKEELKKAKVLLDFTVHYFFQHIKSRDINTISNKTEFLKWWIGETFVAVNVTVQEDGKRLVVFDNIDHEEAIYWTGDVKELNELLDHLCALYLVD